MKKQKRYTGDAPNLVAALNELIGHGVKRATIAEEIGVDTDSISRYLDGSRSRIPFTTGWAIMRMRERVCR